MLPALGQEKLPDILIDGEGWQKVNSFNKPFAYGLAADRQGNVYCASPAGFVIHIVIKDQGHKYWTRTKGQIWGLAFGPDGSLYACQPEKDGILRWSVKAQQDAQSISVAARDVVVSRSGAIYCIVPKEKAVYHIADGAKRKAAEDVASPAGLVLWPDQDKLVIAEAADKRLWCYRVAKDGSLSDGQRHYTLQASPDRARDAVGLAVDAAGRLYATTSADIEVFDKAGQLLGSIAKPADAPLAAMAFGRPERDKLYVICGTDVYARKLKAKGAAPVPATTR